MILQALQDYYQRKVNESDIALFGFESKEIPFIIHLNQDGTFRSLEDTREYQGKKLVGKIYLVPKSQNRQGVKAYQKPNLLWDHYGFILSYAKRDKPKVQAKEKDIQTAKLQHEYFSNQVIELSKSHSESLSLQAVAKFMRSSDFDAVFEHPRWSDCAAIQGCNMTFHIDGDTYPIVYDPVVIKYVKSNPSSDEENQVVSICLVSGELNTIERLHPPVAGVTAKPTPLAAINDGVSPAFSSFGKSQGYNFPVGQQASFAYTTALTHLLRKESRQKVLVGDATTVFWAVRKTNFEEQVSFFFNPPSDDPNIGTQAVKALYESIQYGQLSADDAENTFYILGLTPNSARISVRFWEAATVKQLKKRIFQHFKDIEIIHADNQLPHLPLFRLLLSIATLHKADNIPPNLAGDSIRSILTGLPYPQTLLSAAIRRNRAEQYVSYERAALIKACINRQTRSRHPDIKEELLVSLDIENTNPGYRLGRLFATLEKIQEEANPGLNATIRDRYYGAASANPVTVFATLLKLKNHHLSKMESRGRAVNLEKLLGQIIDGMDSDKPFPSTLRLEDQGRFAVGYYHQRQDFFKKREKTTETESTQPEIEIGAQGELL